MIIILNAELKIYEFGIFFAINNKKLSFVSMKNILSSLLLIISPFIVMSQNITAFSDINGKLYQFDSGIIKMVEHQKVKDLQIANNYIAYQDSQGNYWVIWKGEKIRISQGPTEFIESNNILTAKFTSILKVVDNGKLKNLTAFVSSFSSGDSLIVFQDKIGGNLKYYYDGEIVEFAQVIGDFTFSPEQIGDNVFAYDDGAGNYYAFSNREFYLLFSSNQYPSFSSGLNVIAYNDFENNTFSMFKKGEIIDIESEFALKYKAGHDFVYYQDQSETEKVYSNGESIELGYDLQELTVYDSIITFKEADYFKIWYKDEIHTIYNTLVTKPQVDGGIVAFRNNNNGVSAFVRGEEVEISKQRVSNFWLNGNTIVLQFSPSSYAIWWNGKIYHF